MATLALFVYRSPATATMMSVLQLILQNRRYPWTLQPEHRDALIDRARAIAATRWLTNSPDDDVLVMSDDDFQFTGEAIDSLVEFCKETRGIVAGVTPLKSGDCTAIVPLDFGDAEPWIDPNCPPMEIRRAGGLIAYHRSVFERLAKALPICHQADAEAGVMEAFYPFFMPFIDSTNPNNLEYLSEDYACHERARSVGFKVWVQPKCQVGHLTRDLLVTTKNMHLVREAYLANVRKD